MLITSGCSEGVILLVSLEIFSPKEVESELTTEDVDGAEETAGVDGVFRILLVRLLSIHSSSNFFLLILREELLLCCETEISGQGKREEKK